MTAQSPWRIDGDTATLISPNLSGELHLAKPWDGLQRIAFGRTACDGLRIFCVESQPGTAVESVIDRYVRECDLVVRYRATDQRPVTLQLDWRAFFDQTVSGVDLNVSMQTDLLDSDPTLRVVSAVTSADVIPMASPAAFVIRPRDLPLSILIAAHPSDCEDDEVVFEAGGEKVITLRLFRPGLEKGVIRRARLRTALLPREDDETIAQKSYTAFLNAALPLTT